MKGLKLADVFQVTRIRYNMETTRVDMWTERCAKHRRKLDFRNQNHGTNEQRHLVGNILGLHFILNMMEMITGKRFVYDKVHDLYFREDIEEEDKDLDMSAETSNKTGTST